MKNPWKKRAAALLLCAALTALALPSFAQTVRPGPSGLVRQMVAGKTFPARLVGYTWSGDAADMSLTFSLCGRKPSPPSRSTPCRTATP